MSRIDLTGHDLLTNRALDIFTDDPTLVVVKPFKRLLVEMEDENFHFDSAVLLPDRPKGQEAPSGKQSPIAGLDVLRVCYEFARDHSSHKLVITGHTDTTGDPDYNLTLSQLRAESVLDALLGDRDAWAAVAQKKNQVADYQQILGWVNEYFGWDCDPGAIDDKNGPATRAAVKSFQQTYGDEMGQAIAVDGVVGPETWKAFFDLYMMELAVMMKTTADGLADLRKKLQFVDGGKKAIGCGESHPIEAKNADQFRSAVNRRVELLFFKPGDEPKLNCHPAAGKCDPKLCEIYDEHIYKLEPIPIAPPDATSDVTYLLRSNSGCVPLANRPYTIDVDGDERAGTTGADGLVHHEDVPAGDWELTIDGHTTRLATLPKGAEARVQVVVGYLFEDEEG